MIKLGLAFVLLVAAIGRNNAETVEDDMVIIEAQAERHERSSQEAGRQGRQFFWATGPQYPGGFVFQAWAPRMPLMTGSQCYTSKGEMGSCVTPNSCYSLLYALPKDLPSWALGTKDQCMASIMDKGYVSTYGVCCTSPQTRMPDSRQQQYPAGTFPLQGQFGMPPMGLFGHPHFPQQGGVFPPQQAGVYPPQQGGVYPPQQAGVYPPQQAGVYPPQQGYPPPQPSPKPEEGGESGSIVSAGSDEAEADNSVDNASGRYSKCGVGRNDIKYDQDGNEVEQVERIDGVHPLRVAGGWPADKNEWPWVVMLMNRERQFCDGSIIDEYHILTAAHCVAQMRASDVATLTIRAGAHNLQESARETGVQNVPVKLVVKHKDFTMETLHSDIAILVLKSPIKFTATVRSVCLPQGKQDYAGKLGTVVGWGLLREGGSRPSVLQELTMEIWDNAKCSSTYGDTAPAGITSTMICAGKKGKDSCSGDSGGPFVAPNGDQWEQIGVVSWGIGCGKDIFPGVYTRVTHMMEWIDKVRRLYPN